MESRAHTHRLLVCHTRVTSHQIETCTQSRWDNALLMQGPTLQETPAGAATEHEHEFPKIGFLIFE